MLIDLSKVTFINDFFITPLPDGSTFVLNKVDESLKLEGEDTVVDIKAVNVEVWGLEGEVTSCPCVIGLGNELMQITTEYKEYEGEVLSPSNMEYCTIEVYED